jgi:hypothetical protein
MVCPDCSVELILDVFVIFHAGQVSRFAWTISVSAVRLSDYGHIYVYVYYQFFCLKLSSLWTSKYRICSQLRDSELKCSGSIH